MAALCLMKQGQSLTKDCDVAFGRQAVIFGFVQVNDQNDLCRRRLGFQNADKSCLDHALNRLRGRGHDLGILA